MKLTRVNLYTVNYHGAAALDESVVVWSESAWDAARSFVATFPRDGAKVVHVMHPEGDENFRIDPEPAPAPSGGWVPGEPPFIPDHRFLVADCEGDFSVVRWMPENPHGQWVYGPEDEIAYPPGAITHHNPTPISLEIP